MWFAEDTRSLHVQNVNKDPPNPVLSAQTTLQLLYSLPTAPNSNANGNMKGDLHYISNYLTWAILYSQLIYHVHIMQRIIYWKSSERNNYESNKYGNGMYVMYFQCWICRYTLYLNGLIEEILDQCFPTFSTSRYPWPRSSYLTVPLEENIYFDVELHLYFRGVVRPSQWRHSEDF